MTQANLRAIVLSCDKYRALAEHMIYQYGRLWPGHPFRFRIPYQELRGEDSALREYVATPKPIKATVMKLLADLGDEEWILWCIDDKYPVQFDLPEVEALTRFVLDDPPDVDSILFCRCRDLLDSANLSGEQFVTPDGQLLLRRLNYHQIWIHQFLRVKVIREMFARFPGEIPYAKYMDDLKDRMLPPGNQWLYVTEQNRAIFGESTVSGQVTLSCLRSMAVHGVLPPQSMGLTNEEVTIGVLGSPRPAAEVLLPETEVLELRWRIAVANNELEAARAAAKEAAEKSAEVKVKVQALREERDALRNSTEYRLGRKLVGPFKKLTRAFKQPSPREPKS